MAQKQHIVTETEAFVFDLFKRKLPENLVYHTFSHSKTVAETARKLAKEMQLGEDGIEIATLAGWLHDVGYTEIYKGHEEISVKLTADFLRTQLYPEDRIEMIVGCIRATKIPQQPFNILEEIVADADLAGLGRKTFFEQSELLRIEWERYLGRAYNDDEWLEQNIQLLSSHSYFTRAAQERYANRQSDNLRTLYEQQKKRKDIREEHAFVNTEAPIRFKEETKAQDNNLSALLLSNLSKRNLQRIAMTERRTQGLIGFTAFLIVIVLIASSNPYLENIFIPLLSFAVFSIATLIVTFRVFQESKGRQEERYDQFVQKVHSQISNENATIDALTADAFDIQKETVSKQRTFRMALLLFILGLIISFAISLIGYSTHSSNDHSPNYQHYHNEE